MNHIEDGIEDHENRITVLENAEGEDFVKKAGDTMTGNLTIDNAKQAKPAYLTFDLIVTEFFTRYCGTFSSGTEPL